MFYACYVSGCFVDKGDIQDGIFNNESLRTTEIVAEVIEIEGNCFQKAWIPKIDGF